MTSSRTNKTIIAIGAGVVAIGAVTASAASLGTLTPNSLGTSTAAVTGCQNGSLTVTWPAPAYDDNTYNVDGATLAGINATCYSKSYRMTVADSSGASLGEATGNTGSSGSVSGTFAAPVNSVDIENVTVTIYG